LPQREVLSFEEITQVASAFVALGVNKLRVTGGEPLLRRDLPRLLGMLAALRTPQGEPLDITLTTNGALLARQAAALKAAGLKRITVSLDALDDGVFRRMNDVDFPVTDVLQGIEAAAAAGLWPLKVNMVVRKGVNDSEILPMARHFRHTGVALRFIEFMDVGSHNGWCLDEVLPSQAIIQAIHAEFPLAPRAAASASDTAQLWAYADGAGEVGFISSVTQAFCRQCTRARLSTDGQLYRCLFARQGHSLKAWLRQGAGQSDLVQALTQWWQAREDRYSELRSLAPNPAAPPKVDMHFIGG
jgi:cyclic pyranopterin phosphate synthase